MGRKKVSNTEASSESISIEVVPPIKWKESFNHWRSKITEFYENTDWVEVRSTLWVSIIMICFCATIYLWFSNTGGGDAWFLWFGLWLLSFSLLLSGARSGERKHFFMFVFVVAGVCFAASSVINFKEPTEEAFNYNGGTWEPRSQNFPISFKSPFLRVKEVNFTTRTLDDVFDAITQDGNFVQARFRIEYANKGGSGNEIITADFPYYYADSFKQPAQDLFRQLAVRYSSAEIAEKRLELEEKFLEAAKQHFEKHYIEVSSFGISGITFREIQ